MTGLRFQFSALARLPVGEDSEEVELDDEGFIAEESEDEDIVPQELLDAVEPLDRKEYQIEEMMSETFLDLDQIVQFLDEARKFDPKHDDKLQKLAISGIRFFADVDGKVI